MDRREAQGLFRTKLIEIWPRATILGEKMSFITANQLHIHSYVFLPGKCEGEWNSGAKVWHTNRKPEPQTQTTSR